MVAPGADKTLNRPFVGIFFKLFSPGMISITRKRDDSWDNFLESIYEDSIIFNCTRRTHETQERVRLVWK